MRLRYASKFRVVFQKKVVFDTYLNLNERGVIVFHSYLVLKKKTCGALS